jgi:hypothetical protein
MSWVNDLASGLGITAGAATLAVGMFGACTAAEKAARPEALKEIGSILRDSSWSRTRRPSATIGRVFVWTFGERHLSRKCLGRSLLATLIMLLFLFALQWKPLVEIIRPHNVYAKIGFFLGVPLTAGFPSDYLSLWKTRILLRRINQSIKGMIFVPVIDVVLSVLISMVLMLIGDTVASIYLAAQMSVNFFDLYASVVTGFVWSLSHYITSFSGEYVSMYSLCFVSTLFTSIWTILILVSTSILKLLAPIERFTTWFFDVEKHPIQAIGIVSAALVMTGSLMWSTVRALL